MADADFVFNIVIYGIVIAYILYINFAAYLNTSTGFLTALIRLFQNWVFRLVFLLIVGFFAMDLYPFGGFILAVLLTIAFLNTNMLAYKKGIENFAGDLGLDNEMELAQNTNNCGRYAPLQRLPFNPQGYRPDESLLSSGAPDVLPDDSRYNGEYTDSGVAYEFDMA